MVLAAPRRRDPHDPAAEALANHHRRVTPTAGSPRAEALLELVEHPERFVTPVVLLLLTCQIVQATLVGVLANRLFGVLGLVVAIALDVVVVFVVAEAVPKTWALLHADRVALAVAVPVRALARFLPVRLASRALIVLTNLVLPGKGLRQGPFVSPDDELLAVAELGVEEGVIEEDELALIESIIEFGDTVVREVMVPRPDMVTVPADFRIADVMEVLLLNGFSRVPVCGDDLDDVVGLAYARPDGRRRDGKATCRSRRSSAPPASLPRRSGCCICGRCSGEVPHGVVVDEYGGTAAW